MEQLPVAKLAVIAIGIIIKTLSRSRNDVLSDIGDYLGLGIIIIGVLLLIFM